MIAMRFVNKPRVVNGSYAWDSVQIKEDKNKSFGLYASKPVKHGLALPYGGIVIDELAKNNLETHSRRFKADGTCNTNADYLIVASQEANIFINGHPNIYKKLNPDSPNHAWIGTYCNEPSKHERANCELIFLPTNIDIQSIPNYPHISKEYLVLVHVVFDLEKGEELLLKYGWSESRYKHLNYTPGDDLYEYKSISNATAKPLSGLSKTVCRQINFSRLNNLKDKQTKEIIGKKRSKRGFASNGYNSKRKCGEHLL